ncbi:histone H2B, gonadal-like [Octopus vulgaris]|uniref:Histone H2B, gonadal-like n=1 Tax=Octopus vulgaris TaxID=6645 RepID=A0AA36AIX8_OCTVU|nr:histone H2B, gonadal-like [Octopus vulgaris]
MSIANSFVNDLFDRIASESNRLAHCCKQSTMNSREVQTLVHLLPSIEQTVLTAAAAADDDNDVADAGENWEILESEEPHFYSV